MFTKSLWNQFATIHDHPSLTKDITADVAIIGAGVTGISVAHLLAQRGYNVVVLESLKVGGGTSSHSTGNLYITVDKNLGHLSKKYNNEKIHQVISSRSAAIDQIEKWVQEFDIDCDFKRQPWYLYSTSNENDEQIEKEHKYAQEADVPVEWAKIDQFPLKVSKAVKIDNQAQFNPMRYVQELATFVASENCRIFECTRVTNVQEKDKEVILHTTGGKVQAKSAIHATHIPKGVKVVQTALSMYREYGIACPADGKDFPEGIFWGYHKNGKKYSSRVYQRDGKKFVIVVGEVHRVGQADNNIQSIKNLEQFAREHYDLNKVAYRWGGQHYVPADLLPYIGREIKNSNIFIATGYSTDGLVYGTLAGMIIADEISEKENEYAELYNLRFTPFKSAANFIKENINTAAQYLKDIPGKAEEEDYKNIQKGEGAIVEKNGEKIAASRDEHWELKLLSAVCTHMKCIVNWNDAEQTWDCPCHASRFKPDGTVLEGPAYQPLSKIEIQGSKVKKEE